MMVHNTQPGKMAKRSVPPPAVGWNQLELAIEQAAEAVAITDRGGTIQYVNPAFCAMTGYTAAEAMGQNPRLLKSGRHSAEFYAEMWHTIARGEVWHGELTNRRKDGTQYAEEMTIAPVRDASGETISFIAIKQDISARLEAEEQRRFLASIVECTDDAIIGVTPGGLIQSWNRAAERLYGYSAAEILGQPISSLAGEGRAEQLSALMAGLRQGEPARRLEVEGRCKDGTLIDVSVSASPIRGRRGEVVAAAAIVRDVTRQRADERALRVSEQRLASAFQNAPFGFSLGRADGRWLMVNAALCRMLGYSEQDLLSRGWDSVSHPDDRGLSQQATERLLRERPPWVEFEKRYIHRNGQLVWGRVRLALVDDGWGSFHCVGYIEDITGRKRAEEQARQSEERYRRLVENLPVVTWTCDVEGRITHISSNITSVCGYEPDEIIGSDANLWFGLVHLDDIGNVGAALQALFEQGRPLAVEYRIRNRQGRWIWVLARASRTFRDGGVLHADGVLSEITARKLAEESLRASEARYSALFENMQAGVACCRLLRGEGDDLDVECLAVNRTFEQQSGINDLAGRRFSSALPGVLHANHELAEGFQAVVQTGLPARFESYIAYLGRWFSIATHGLGGDDFVIVLEDITELKRAEAAVEERSRLTSLAAEVGLVLAKAANQGQGLQECAAAYLRYTGAVLARIWTLDERGEELTLRASAGLLTEHDECQGKVRVGETRIGWIAAAGKPVVSVEMQNDPELGDLAWARREGLVGFAGYPLVVEGSVVGVVAAYKRRQFGENTIRTFAAVADQIAQFITRKRAEEKILSSLREKEALLREIHHRVKNNLQVVCSLLKLNSRSLKDAAARKVFADMQHRVKAMALVHETLYQSRNLAGIDFPDYVQRLGEHLLRTYGLSPRHVQMELAIEPVVLPVDVAIPCALMLTELISNSAKYAFAAKPEGRLSIGFRRTGEGLWALVVEDSGTTPAESNLGEGFGLELVRLLAEQLGGSMQVRREAGFQVCVSFPLADSETAN